MITDKEINIETTNFEELEGMILRYETGSTFLLGRTLEGNKYMLVMCVQPSTTTYHTANILWYFIMNDCPYIIYTPIEYIKLYPKRANVIFTLKEQIALKRA